MAVRDEEVALLLRRPRLRFPSELEQEYRRDYATRWLATNRAAFVLGAAIYVVFGVVDPLAASHSLVPVLVLRGVALAALLLLLLLSTTSAYLRVMQPASALVVFISGAAIVGMEMVLGPADHGRGLYVFGMGIVTFFGYAAPRLRFWYATAVGWALVLASLAIVPTHHVLSDRHEVIAFAITFSLLVATNVVGMIACYFIDTGLRQNFLQRLEVEKERERSDVLLLNVLPEPVADRLKRGEAVADALDEVAVLFADLVGFTPYAATLEPSELVALLNEIFSRFDRLSARHQVEKVKTIGDEYMAVAGIPASRPDDAARIGALALDMLHETRRMDVSTGSGLRLRIGINVGPVVAGVIGLQKFSYDLWGDTVNTASRMASHGEPDEIQVTAEVYARLRDAFEFDGPRSVDVKGKGPMSTYVLRGERRD